MIFVIKILNNGNEYTLYKEKFSYSRSLQIASKKNIVPREKE